MKKLVLFSLFAAVMASCAPQAGETLPQLGTSPIDEVVSSLTLEEKLQLVVGTGRRTSETIDDSLRVECRKLLPGAAGFTYPIERLGIPAVVLSDGPAGVNIAPTRKGDSLTYYCTHFPIGTLLASTWNQELVYEVGRAIGEEALEYGADILLAPALNIHRNPLCGRNFEYFSEDPVVSGKIAAAYVNGVQSKGVGTSVKHYAVNNQESNRMAMDTHLTPRAAREIYLKGFEIVVKESKPTTIMSSYPHVNGKYASESYDLMTTILRDEWGFDGMIMSDWYAGSHPVDQMKSGNDMLQPGLDKQYVALQKAAEDGTLPMSDLDRNVKRILEMILQTPRFKGHKPSNRPDLNANAAVTRQSAVEGMVLLKNDGAALPVAADVKKIALLGYTSYDFIAGGTGSGDVNRAYTVSLLDGLKNCGYEIDGDLKESYVKYIAGEKERIKGIKQRIYSKTLRPVERVLSDREMRKLAKSQDMALVTIGRSSGEYLDRDLPDFLLTEEEQQLISQTCEAFHNEGKKVVVVLNIGGVIETASWKELPDAILCAWQAGQEGGNSVADVLSGRQSPSGRLTMTWPLKWEDHASSADFPTEGRLCNPDFTNHTPHQEVEYLWDYTNYCEDIYVGYRYFDSFDKEVSYPFGYGLSYTTFDYTNATIERKRGTYTVTVDVTNTGKMAGKEVVQLYVAAPDSKALNKPEKELKAFAKTAELQPGETRTVTLKVKAEDLAWYNETISSWVVDKGDYSFLVGASSRDIRATLTAPVKASKKKTFDVLKLEEPIELLKR